MMTDGSYTWLTKYGKTAEEAFNSIKNVVVTTAKKSIEGNFEELDNLDLDNTVKWKIAFMYNTDNLMPIFSRDMLTGNIT